MIYSIPIRMDGHGSLLLYIIMLILLKLWVDLFVLLY